MQNNLKLQNFDKDYGLFTDQGNYEVSIRVDAVPSRRIRNHKQAYKEALRIVGEVYAKGHEEAADTIVRDEVYGTLMDRSGLEMKLVTE